MKKLCLQVIALFTAIFAVTFSYGQSVVVGDTTIKGKSAIVISSEAEARPLLKEWRAFLRKEHKIKTKASRTSVSADMITWPAVGQQALNLTTLFVITAQGSSMIVFAKLSADESQLSPKTNPQEYYQLRKISEDFVKSYLNKYYDRLISDKEKVVKSAKREDKALSKEIKKLDRSIAKDKKKVVKLSKRIEQNTTALENNRLRQPELKQTLELKKQMLQEAREKKKKI